MTFAPRFSPEGNRVVFSRAENGASNIFVLDLRTRRPARPTEGNAIDTTPSYSPDGARIVFNSDPAGSQQLYVLYAHRCYAQRRIFDSGHCRNPLSVAR